MCHFNSAIAFTVTSASMASDFSFPASRPYPGWGPGPNTPIEPPQTPLSGMDKLQAYPPDVYTTPPPATQPLHPFPMQPSRLARRASSRSESPAQVGRSPSRSAWSVTPVPEGPSPIQKTYKTFLQWKASAQATTAEFLRNGFPSPVAWVLISNHVTAPQRFTFTVGICRGPCYPPECYHWWCGPQGSMAHCSNILRGRISSLLH